METNLFFKHSPVKTAFVKDFYELNAWTNHHAIIGIDEVGRGCSAGPVVAAAVLLQPYTKHKLLIDSKKLDQKKREHMFAWLCEHATYAIGISNNHEIDAYNIYSATQRAMKRALAQLVSILPSDQQKIIVIDAMPLVCTSFAAQAFSFTKGESRSSSIAAASIIAKVTRDRIMKTLDSSFPSYQLGTHKGYCTKKHRNAIDSQGSSFIHRTTFLSAREDDDEQQTIFGDS